MRPENCVYVLSLDKGVKTALIERKGPKSMPSSNGNARDIASLPAKVDVPPFPPRTRGRNSVCDGLAVNLATEVSATSSDSKAFLTGGSGAFAER